MSMLTRNNFVVMLVVLCMSGLMAHAIEIDAAALYRFEDQTDAIAVGEFLTDASGNERRAEAFGSAIDLVAGHASLGQAGSFNANMAFVDFEDVDTSGDFTFAFWMKSATLGQTQKYLLSLSNGSGGGEQTAVIYQYEQNTVELYSGNSAMDLRPGSQLSVPDTEWHHIVYTRSGSDYDAYLDGAKHDIATLDGPVHNPQYLSLGGTGHLRAGGAVNLYEGLLDDVLVMTRGVDQAEVDFILLGFTNELASAPSPDNGADDVLRDYVLTWKPGQFAATHNVTVGEDFEDVNNATVPTASDLDVNALDAGRFEFGRTYYWRVDEVNGAPDHAIFKGNVWSFTAEPYSISIPGSTITVTASSSSNEFSTPDRTIDGSGLDANGMHAIGSETMWFTTPVDLAPWIQYEFDDIKKLDVMTVWNSNSAAESAIGWGVKDVEIAYSVDGVNWDVLADANQFSRAPGTPTYNQVDEIDFGGAAARFVRLNIQSNWGGVLMAYGLSEVQFSMIPAVARTPEPASGAVDVPPDAQVTWRAGRGVAPQHTVYVSTDQNEVAAGTALSVTTGTNTLDLTPLDLELGQTYYWRADEVNEAEVPSVWAGPVWSFSTPDSLVVDDFESYNNVSPNRPFQTWLDGFGYSADEFFPAGYGGNGTGAAIGHDIWSLSSSYYNGDIMETSITMPGSRKALPFYYTNTGGAASQTEHLFAEAQNWSIGGAKTLLLDFYGAPDNGGQFYVKINDTKVVYPGDPASIAVNVWQTWPVDLSMVEGIENVTSLAIGVDGVGVSGMLIIDDIRLSSEAPVADQWGDELAISAYEWAPEGFLNTPAAPDYWGSDVDMTKLTDGVIASDYSGGLCAGWNFSTAGGAFGPTLYFDLRSIQNIGAVAIFHQPQYYGFETVMISVSSLDNPNRFSITDVADWTGQEIIHRSDHWGVGDSGNAPSVMQTVPIRQEGRWVRLQFLNQEPGYDTAWTMFSEFKFYAE